MSRDPHDEPRHNAVDAPEPPHDRKPAPHREDRPAGERQDDPGEAPVPADRTDDVPAGAIAARREGPRQGTGGDDPFAAHRGHPATFANGAANGSGAGAGGGGAGIEEEPDPDKGGGGRPTGG